MHGLPPLLWAGQGTVGWQASRLLHTDQLVEGSVLGVPREEVGLGEQCELLPPPPLVPLALLALLLLPPWAVAPARRCTMGFWANSTPA